MSIYVAIWPADENPADALHDLYDLLEAAGLAATSLPEWAAGDDTLFCRIDVQPEHSHAGDTRPWQSRGAAVDEWFDLEAA